MAKELPHWQWLKETPVAILEENELPVWRSAEQVREAMAQMGATLLRYPAIRWGLHTFGESKYLPKYPDLDGRDLFGEVCEELKTHGLKIMAYCHIGGSLHCEAFQIHPEWAGRDAQGNPTFWNGPNHHFCGCVCNEEYRGAIVKAIGEVARNYAVDAVYLDAPAWYRDCYCPSCRDKYAAMHDEPLGDSLSFEDGTQQKYNRMRDVYATRAVQEVREELAEFPELPLLFNMHMTYFPTHNTGVPEYTWNWADGGNTIEVHRPGSFWEMYQSVRLGESLGKISMGYLPPGPYETMRSFASDELKILAGAYMMHAATPMLGTVSTYIRDPNAGVVMRPLMQQVKKHREVYYRSRPVHEIAVIYSRNAAENFAGYDPGLIGRSFGGMFRLLLNAHVHFETLFDTKADYETLKQYRAVVVPFGQSLPADVVEALEQYVREGGNLLATGRFTLADETGKPLDNFALADVLGVDFVSFPPDAPYRSREYRETAPRYGYSPVPECYLKLTDPSLQAVIPAANKLTPTSDAVTGVPEAVRWIDYCIVKARETAEVLAELFLPSGGAFGEEPDFPLGTPPGITLHRYGKGKAMYVAAPIETHYERRRLGETRKLVAAMVDMLLGWRRVKLDAPSGVVMHLAEDGRRKYLHLLNYCGTMHDDGQAVEEVLPVHDLTVRLSREEFTAPSIKRLSDSAEISPHESETGYEFTIPRLGVFETFVIKERNVL